MATSESSAVSTAVESAHEAAIHLPASVIAPVAVPAPLITPEHAAANALVALASVTSAANVPSSRIAVRLEGLFPALSQDPSPASAFKRVPTRSEGSEGPSRKRARNSGMPTGNKTASCHSKRIESNARGGKGEKCGRSSTDSSDSGNDLDGAQLKKLH